MWDECELGFEKGGGDMRKVLSYFVLLALALVPFGCTKPSDNPDGTNTGPNPLIETAIDDGTAAALSLGLPLLPDQAATLADANIALTAINGSVLPVLTGSSTTAGTTALQNLVTQVVQGKLTSLSGAPMVQNALQLALPLLVSNLPKLTDASGAVTANIPPAALAYLTDFFKGASAGLTAYTSGKSMKDLPKNYDPKTGDIVAGSGKINVNDIVAALTAVQKGQKALPKK
jgi:hypothetical protein